MVVQKNDWKFCPACKAIVGQNDKTCSKCGYDLMGKTVVSQTTYKEKEVSVPINNVNKPIFIKPLIGFLLIIVILVSGFFAYSNILWGEDKIAYDLVVEHIYSFKNPSSVKVISGDVTELDAGTKHAFLRLSATNGYGGTVAGYYYLAEDFMIDLEDEDERQLFKLLNSDISDKDFEVSIALCRLQERLNITKINRALERKFN